jgi:hypothetical protein
LCTSGFVCVKRPRDYFAFYIRDEIEVRSKTVGSSDSDQSERRYGIPEIVRGFKTFSARHVNERAGKRGVLWQRGYYERIIRNEKALDGIRAYIANNPAQWADDPDNIALAASAERGRV